MKKLLVWVALLGSALLATGCHLGAGHGCGNPSRGTGCGSHVSPGPASSPTPEAQDPHAGHGSQEVLR